MLLSDCATLATALFTGAAVYITLVEHPARLQCASEIAVAQWRRSGCKSGGLGVLSVAHECAVVIIRLGTAASSLLVAICHFIIFRRHHIVVFSGQSQI